MPEEALAAAKAALDKADELVREVRKSNVNQRLQMVIITVLSVIVVCLGLMVITGRSALNDLKSNTTADRQRDTGAVLEACRSRNGFQQSIREILIGDHAALISLAPDPKAPAAVAAQERLDAAIPPADDPQHGDRDCDGDGQLTRSDYPT